MKGYKKKFTSLSKEDQAQVLVYESAIKAARKERHRIIDRVGHRKKRAERVLNGFSDYMEATLDDMRTNPNEAGNRAITATMKDLYSQGTMTDDDMHAIYSTLYMSGLNADDIWSNMPLADVMEYTDKNSEFYQNIMTKYITGDIVGFQKANTARYTPTITAEEEHDKYQYEQQIKNYQAAIEAIFNK
jgi:hypothetical protein